MRLKIAKETLLNVLTHVIGAIERRHTLNILSNVKIKVDQQTLTVTGSDLEVELVASSVLEQGACIESGETTVPARKLMDICKSLPSMAIVDLQIKEDQRCVIVSGQSQFTLSTLPAEDYPLLATEQNTVQASVSVAQKDLKKLFEKTAFAMAVQDVRFYLTGTLLEVEQQKIRAVTTDGHRLALCEVNATSTINDTSQVIIPRKAVNELQRLLSLEDSPLTVALGREFFKVTVELPVKEKETGITIYFTTKLIDGKFPDYRRVVPTGADKTATLAHDAFKQSLQRVSILSNEKLRGVFLNFRTDNLQLKANNPEQDEAVEDFAMQYQGDILEMSFNAQYLIDVLTVLDGEDVQMHMTEANQSVLITDPTHNEQVYVVMPMRI